MNNYVSRMLVALTSIPVIGFLAAKLLRVQYFFWKRWPGLVDRASNFLLMGGLTTTTQVGMFFTLKFFGMATLPASLLAVESSIVFSFAANMFVTWRDRIEGLNSQQRVIAVPILFAFFNLFHPAFYILGWGISFTESLLNIPFWAAWAICQTLTVCVSYLGADKVIFGIMVRIISRLSGRNHEASCMGETTPS